jgi:acetyl esterase/lipase/lysophospholipase L1-like esterase
LKIKKSFLILIALIPITFNAEANNIEPNQILQYKVINGDSLNLHIFKPPTSIEPTAAIVFFFGGGWTGGHPRQFYQQSKYLASRGILAISAEYRIKGKHGTTPFDCVEDGKSAIRWVRQHAKELNIDPNKIVASGASAGGHVAICTAIIDGYENPDENLTISSMPNAVIGYNPVFDTTDKGYGSEKVKGREKEISPCHQIKTNLPPMINFHGNKDTTVPIENAERFTQLMKYAGNQCELVTLENVGHGFFNGDLFRNGSGDKYFNLTMYDTDIFLINLGYLQGKPTINRDLILLACSGDSNTQRNYPQFLQQELGDGYQVKNFGKDAATIIDGSYFPYHKTPQYKDALKFSPDIVLLMFGTNDANPKWCKDKDRKTDFKGTPQEEFKSGYIQLINNFKKKNPQVEIYALTPLPVWAKKKPKDENLQGRKKQLNEWVIPTIKEIAKEQGLHLIDINKLMKNKYQYTIDGVHINNEGYKILAQKIYKKLGDFISN